MYFNKLALPLHSQASDTKHASGRRLARLRKDLVEDDRAVWNLAFVDERNGTLPAGRTKHLILQPRYRMSLHQRMYLLKFRKLETRQVCADKVDNVGLKFGIVETELREQFKGSLFKETQIQ